MKQDKLSGKARTIMANMRGISGPVRAQDLAFLAPKVSGSREWAMSTLRRLVEMGLLANGPRQDNAMTFALTEAGNAAVLAQTQDIDIEPDDVLYFYDSPLLFTADILGATRLVMADDLRGGTYLVSTPDASRLDAVIQSRSKVVEGMVCEPCLRIERKDGEALWSLSATRESASSLRAYCGESAYLDPSATGPGDDPEP